MQASGQEVPQPWSGQARSLSLHKHGIESLRWAAAPERTRAPAKKPRATLKRHSPAGRCVSAQGHAGCLATPTRGVLSGPRPGGPCRGRTGAATAGRAGHIGRRHGLRDVDPPPAADLTELGKTPRKARSRLRAEAAYARSAEPAQRFHMARARLYTDRRAFSAAASVPSSSTSSAPPIGTPCARRVTDSPDPASRSVR